MARVPVTKEAMAEIEAPKRKTASKGLPRKVLPPR